MGEGNNNSSQKELSNEEQSGKPGRVKETASGNRDAETTNKADTKTGTAAEAKIKAEEGSATGQMEVHHHSHAGHGKKNWKSYFREFLMLFLAVFCGFLAEYQLEHVIENQREKAFVRSLLEDLTDDQKALDHYLADLQAGTIRMDSLITVLGDVQHYAENGNQLYYLGRMSPRIKVLNNNTRTFEQLKNSGSFRLIRKTEASNKIMAYYAGIRQIRELEALFFQEFNQYKIIASRIYDPAVFRMMEQPDGEILREANNPALRTNNPDLLNELGIYAVYMNGSRRSIIPLAVQLKENGKGLAMYLGELYGK